ncbi:hypothetical protein BDV30DRAFT_139632 [Aspergillus minisclerotigenes]|uniref:C2H2-type domain-containing protein n=1 Tax=Aspergillus minisclerotigenes TaxID=656917 RepID=A0A5N6JKD8_9EURO|nr:hypothetical protein BDV30DRAFT_139632 [Aspergillus minisclerotigenes]
MRVECNICEEQLGNKSTLMNRAEKVHGTVSCLARSALGPIFIFIHLPLHFLGTQDLFHNLGF